MSESQKTYSPMYYADGSLFLTAEEVARIMARHEDTLRIMANTECESCGYWYGEHERFCPSQGEW